MNTYRIRAKPDIRKAAQGWPALSEELLAQTIVDVALRELSQDSFGQITVDVRLERPNHGEALNEIATLVEQSGYALIDTLVTESISAETQRLGIAAATFLFGTGFSENPLVGLAVSGGATWLAEQTGWVVDRVLAEYAASHDVLGEWTLTKIPRATPVGHQAETGFPAA